MSNGKHRFGQPRRISDIHARLIPAGLIGGALSRVTNPISGRTGLLELSLIRTDDIRPIWLRPLKLGQV
jgi:hypothetical protein